MMDDKILRRTIVAPDILRQLEELKAENARLKEELEEGDYWMERHKDLIENGHCPDCYRGDEDIFTRGHEKGCMIGEAEVENDRLRAALFCEECHGTGLDIAPEDRQALYSDMCSKCGPIRNRLKEGGHGKSQ